MFSHYYQVLGLPQYATAEDIEAVCKYLLIAWDPDKIHTWVPAVTPHEITTCKEVCAILVEARLVLKDAETRDSFSKLLSMPLLKISDMQTYKRLKTMNEERKIGLESPEYPLYLRYVATLIEVPLRGPNRSKNTQTASNLFSAKVSGKADLVKTEMPGMTCIKKLIFPNKTRDRIKWDGLAVEFSHPDSAMRFKKFLNDNPQFGLAAESYQHANVVHLSFGQSLCEYLIKHPSQKIDHRGMLMLEILKQIVNIASVKQEWACPRAQKWSLTPEQVEMANKLEDDLASQKHPPRP